MQAVVLEGYGEVDVLKIQEIPLPKPGPTEVRVKVAATALNRTRPPTKKRPVPRARGRI